MKSNDTEQLNFGFKAAGNLFEYLEQWSYDDGFEPNPATVPTDHPPGSTEKVNVLAARVLNNEDLWHQDDKQTDAPTNPILELLKSTTKRLG